MDVKNLFLSFFCLHWWKYNMTLSVSNRWSFLLVLRRFLWHQFINISGERTLFCVLVFWKWWSFHVGPVVGAVWMKPHMHASRKQSTLNSNRDEYADVCMDRQRSCVAVTGSSQLWNSHKNIYRKSCNYCTTSHMCRNRAELTFLYWDTAKKKTTQNYPIHSHCV